MKTISILKNGFVATLTLAILFSFSSCKKTEKDQQSDDQEKTEKLSEKEVKKEVRDVVYPIPNSYRITNTLNEIGASFIIGISNEFENVDKYVTEEKQALNLGVYSTDITYTSTYNMKQYTMNYMDVNKKLVKELGITGAFTPDFFEQVQANFDNKEKLSELISNSFYDTYEHMVKKGKDELALMVVAGSWIEAMYITTHISENTYHNKQVVDLIAEQENTLNKLFEILKPHKEDETIKKILDGLQPIKNVYDNRKETGFTEEQVKTIQEEIATLRNDIIS